MEAGTVIVQGLLYNAGPPPFVGRERAELPCGCFVAVGIRTDNGEVATAGCPCVPEHRDMHLRFNLALTDSLVNPTSRPLIDVVDELLAEVAS